VLVELPVAGSCSGNSFSGSTDGTALGKHGDDATFVIANVAFSGSSMPSTSGSSAAAAVLSDLTLVAHYESTKANELQGGL
jgi:hypothetical protein